MQILPPRNGNDDDQSPRPNAISRRTSFLSRLRPEQRRSYQRAQWLKAETIRRRPALGQRPTEACFTRSRTQSATCSIFPAYGSSSLTPRQATTTRREAIESLPSASDWFAGRSGMIISHFTGLGFDVKTAPTVESSIPS
jgi:hypothetical protein